MFHHTYTSYGNYPVTVTVQNEETLQSISGTFNVILNSGLQINETTIESSSVAAQVDESVLFSLRPHTGKSSTEFY